jgi:hypothetical protein
LVLALASAPFVFVSSVVLNQSKVVAQYVVRLVLGTLVVGAFRQFRTAVGRVYGEAVGNSLGLLCCTQFHLVFYMSRTLPNVFALALVLLALSFWLTERHELCFFLFTLVVCVFRVEVVLLLGGVALDCLLRRQVSIGRLLLVGAGSAAVSLLLSIPLDSWLWRRWLWPEGTQLEVVCLSSCLSNIAFFSQAVSSCLMWCATSRTYTARNLGTGTSALRCRAPCWCRCRWQWWAWCWDAVRGCVWCGQLSCLLGCILSSHTRSSASFSMLYHASQWRPPLQWQARGAVGINVSA